MAFRASKGHVGSALSVVEIVVCGLSITRGLGSDLNSRDRFVLSKGHAASALYAGLLAQGLLTKEDLETYCVSGSMLATHPLTQIPGIDFATGSLGQGITFAVGAALAAKMRADGGQVFCVLSDSEINEGSTWESFMIASQLRLDNLLVALDYNGQQALGFTNEVLNIGGAPKAIELLGWNVQRCAGHDVNALMDSIGNARHSKLPSLIVCDTKSGHGVDYMEEKIEWHYLPMTQPQYESAKKQIRWENVQ